MAQRQHDPAVEGDRLASSTSCAISAKQSSSPAMNKAGAQLLARRSAFASCHGSHGRGPPPVGLAGYVQRARRRDTVFMNAGSSCRGEFRELCVANDTRGADCAPR